MATYRTKDGTKTGFIPGLGVIVDGVITVPDEIVIENANLEKVTEAPAPATQAAPAEPATPSPAPAAAPATPPAATPQEATPQLTPANQDTNQETN